ncbi:MAG TPA: hypothetical protein VEH31_11970 [Streptosporangiaceae bacterium]|nr:hypothetical protein [Streptosporangiaceae bacterium]
MGLPETPLHSAPGCGTRRTVTRPAFDHGAFASAQGVLEVTRLA